MNSTNQRSLLASAPTRRLPREVVLSRNLGFVLWIALLVVVTNLDRI